MDAPVPKAAPIADGLWFAGQLVAHAAQTRVLSGEYVLEWLGTFVLTSVEWNSFAGSWTLQFASRPDPRGVEGIKSLLPQVGRPWLSARVRQNTFVIEVLGRWGLGPSCGAEPEHRGALPGGFLDEPGRRSADCHRLGRDRSQAGPAARELGRRQGCDAASETEAACGGRIGSVRRVGRLRAGSRALPGERPASGTPSPRPLCRLAR